MRFDCVLVIRARALRGVSVARMKGRGSALPCIAHEQALNEARALAPRRT